MEMNGAIVCFGVTLISVLFFIYIAIRKTKNKSRQPADHVGGIASMGVYPELENKPKKPYSMSEEIRKLWKYN